MTGEGNGHYCYDGDYESPEFRHFENTDCQKHCFDENERMKFTILFNSNLGVACKSTQLFTTV